MAITTRPSDLTFVSWLDHRCAYLPLSLSMASSMPVCGPFLGMG